MVYSDNAVDIFDAYKVTWLQTIPTKKVIPMDSGTSLSLLTNEESKDCAQLWNFYLLLFTFKYTDRIQIAKNDIRISMPFSCEP